MHTSRVKRHIPAAAAILAIICQLSLPFAARGDEFNLDDILNKPTEELMDMELGSLLDMEIASAGKIVEKIAEIPASVVVITREDIERNGWRSFVEILRNTPGFYHIYDFDDDTVGVRGALNEHNLVLLVNGVTQHDNLLGNVAVPVEQIDRIEIVRGPMSVIHGSGAFLGSINIVTNHIPYGDPLNMISASYGSGNTYTGFVRKSGETAYGDYTVNASVYGTHGVQENWSDHWDTSDLASQGVDMDTGGMLERKNANFNLSVTGTSGFYGDIQYNHVKNGFIDELDHFYGDGSVREKNLFTSKIGWKRKLGNAWTMDLNLLYGRSEWNEYNDYGSDAYMNLDGADNRMEAELNLVWEPSDRFNILTGIKYKIESDGSYDADVLGIDLTGLYGLDLSSDDLRLQGTYDIGDREVRSAFTQLNYRPFDCLKLIAGIRAEQYMAFDTTLQFRTSDRDDYSPVVEHFNDDEKVHYIPRAAAVYSITEHQYLKFMYGKANKPYAAKDIDLGVTRQDLEPEEIETLELIYLLDKKPFSVSLSLFRNDIDKLIGYVVAETDSGYEISIANTDRRITEGSEMILGFRPTGNLDMQFSLTWQDTEVKNASSQDGQYLFASPEYLAKFRVAYTWERFTASVTALYVDEMLMFMPPADGGPPEGGDGPPQDDEGAGQTDTEITRPDPTEIMDSAITVDFNLRYENEETGFFSAFRVNNLLDEEYYYPLFPQQLASYNGFPAPGREFTLTMGWKF